MAFNLSDVFPAPSAAHTSRQFFIPYAGDDLVVRPTTPLDQREGYYIEVGKERLVFGTPIELLGCLQERGYRGHRISIDAPYQHTTWTSVDDAHAWCVANREGYVIDCPRGMFSHKTAQSPRIIPAVANLQIMLTLRGTLVSHRHRPGNASKRHFGRTDFSWKHRVCFSNPRDGLLAGLILGSKFSYEEHRARYHLRRSSTPFDVLDDLDPTVESAISEYGRDLNPAKLGIAETAFSLAYSDEIKRYAETQATRSYDVMGFRKN